MIPFKFSVFLQNNHLNDFYLIPKDYSEVTEFYFEVSELSGGDFCSNLVRKPLNFEHDATKSLFLEVTMDGYLCSLLQHVLQTSGSYRTCFIKTISNKFSDLKKVKYTFTINVKLVLPVRDILDYRGNEICEILCLERRELDNAMAWLSTLGGAFSALGDNFERCATIAGKISIRQLEIALRLSDPFLVARCKLYAALSLIQRQNFKFAKELIRAQYQIATQGIIKDNKLKAMCLGIWAKMKYDKSRLKESRKKHTVR